MASGSVLTSAAGVLSLLDEDEEELQIHALEQLDNMVDSFWAEIASVIPKIETLYEDEDFKSRELAASVASKVFYHLEDLDDALKYALGAGDRFDVTEQNEYVDTLIAKCIDMYIAVRVSNYDNNTKARVRETKFEEEPIDERLIQIVEKMFERCINDGKFKQALGIALEARRIDKMEEAIKASDDVEGMLEYCFNLSNTVIESREFRHATLRCLVQLYSELPSPDYINMCQCLLFLDDAKTVASNLDHIIKKDDANENIMAYQVAFELYENQNQPFLLRVCQALPQTPEDENDERQESDSNNNNNNDDDGADAMDTSGTPAATPDAAYLERLKMLKNILTGDTPTSLYLHFLYAHNKTDLQILESIKDKLEARNSVTHNAAVIAHAIMHVGTTVDKFLRNNLDWLGRATNWAKFTATASIGVIHRGHHKESLQLLQPYLPQAGQQGSPYQEGGALFALGLIHANHRGDKTPYILDALRNAGTNEIIQHGACLGIGLTAMGTGDMEVFEELKNVMYTESAVAGHAAGMAMGLVLCGSNNADALEEMLAYAHDTKHEKIISGLAMGIAMVMYGLEEEADVMIEQLCAERDHLLRYGGMYTIALAYVGTSNNSAIRKLLHVAVSDLNDDVRRAAVIALGFVMSDNPQQVPKVVALLSESYNMNVRYGAAMAVGIACAGTGSQEALALLEPLLKDKVDLVRQAAYIATAMVLILHNQELEPRVKTFRARIFATLNRKGDTMTKLGSILAAGILDAGGRNMSISLLSPSGHKQTGAIVGMALFPQFWYWFPCTHFLSLVFSPTALIGLNKDLKIPIGFEFVSNTRPSLFAYPAPMEVKKEEKKKEIIKATLSVTAKAKARQQKKKGGGADESEDAMDTSEASETGDKKESDEKEAETAAEEEKEEKEKKEEKEPEPNFIVLENPARVTEKQQVHLNYSTDQRYLPVKTKLTPGFLLLKDTTPGEEEAFVVFDEPKIGVPGIDDDEPDAPDDFQFFG